MLTIVAIHGICASSKSRVETYIYRVSIQKKRAIVEECFIVKRWKKKGCHAALFVGQDEGGKVKVKKRGKGQNTLEFRDSL